MIEDDGEYVRNSFKACTNLVPGNLYQLIHLKGRVTSLCAISERGCLLSLYSTSLLVFLRTKENGNRHPRNVFLFEDSEVTIGPYLECVGWDLKEVNTNDV